MSDLKTINLKDEKYKDFLIRMAKVRGEQEYNVDIVDRRIGKKK